MRRIPSRRFQRRRRDLLESYVAPQVVAHILSNGRTPLLSGVRVPVTVMFADIRNFTRFAAALPADRVVAFLDDSFAAITTAAAAHGATIDKLIGDAVMVLFGVPRARGDEAQRALLAASAMHRAFAAVLRRWRPSLPTRLRLGLGIGCASGDVVLANVGSPVRMDYTVIGAAVNLAARLTDAAGGGTTLVSRAVRDAARAGGSRSLRFGRTRRLAVKGIRGTVPAYPAVLVADGSPPRAGRTVTDPVCGMKLLAGGALRTVYRRRTYSFCSVACQRAFQRHPARYASPRRVERRQRPVDQ